MYFLIILHHHRKTVFQIARKSVVSYSKPPIASFHNIVLQAMLLCLSCNFIALTSLQKLTALFQRFLSQYHLMFVKLFNISVCKVLWFWEVLLLVNVILFLLSARKYVMSFIIPILSPRLTPIIFKGIRVIYNIIFTFIFAFISYL